MPLLGLHTSLILRKIMHHTGLFSAHGLSSAPVAQPFLRPSLALPLAAHVVYGILTATGDAATCAGWDAPMRTWWATWGAAGRGLFTFIHFHHNT